jgi:hypothetical protein
VRKAIEATQEVHVLIPGKLHPNLPALNGGLAALTNSRYPNTNAFEGLHTAGSVSFYVDSTDSA